MSERSHTHADALKMLFIRKIHFSGISYLLVVFFLAVHLCLCFLCPQMWNICSALLPPPPCSAFLGLPASHNAEPLVTRVREAKCASVDPLRSVAPPVSPRYRGERENSSERGNWIRSTWISPRDGRAVLAASVRSRCWP